MDFYLYILLYESIQGTLSNTTKYCYFLRIARYKILHKFNIKLNNPIHFYINKSLLGPVMRKSLPEAKERFLPEILLTAAAIIVGLTTHFIVKTSSMDSGLEYMFIFIAEILVFLFYCGHKIYLTHRDVNNHQSYIDGFITKELRPDILNLVKKEIIYYKGESKILKFIEEKKREINHTNFYAIWCIDYQQQLHDYFQNEKVLDDNEVKRYRLINKEALKDKGQIKTHLQENKESIITGKYTVYSTTFSSFEFVICFRAVEGENAIAIQLFKDTANPRVELAVASHEGSFVSALKQVFESYQKEENRLNIGASDSNNFDNIVETWLKAPTR
jgi:hypothetical protein